MRNIFIAISSVLSVLSTIPYILDTVKLKTKPRVVSWFTWMALGLISGSASLLDDQYPAAIFSFISAFICGTIFILGLYYDGEKSISSFDIVCQLVAIAGLFLWYIFNSPAVAIIAAIGIDLVASLPTIKHSWQKPFEETWTAYFFYIIAASFTIAAVTDYKITSVATPIYIFCINLLLTTILLTRRRATAKI